MRPFNEVLREAKQGNRPAVSVSVVNPEDLVNPVVRNPISKKGKQKSKPQGPELPSSAQRAKRFSQSFGTPTGANPFTGKATYVPPEALTKLPPSAKGTVDQSAYSNVDVGDLERKRGARTAEVPGKPGVRAANPEGVRNYALSQGGYARSGRNMSASEFADRSTRANTIAANPSSPEYKKIETKINQEVGGRRATRGRNSPSGIAADTAFRQRLDLDTPEGAAANRDFAKEMERLRRQNKGERDLLAAIDDVDTKPSGRQGSQGRRPAVSTSQTPSQVVANTQQSQRISQAKAEVPTKITPGKTKPGTGLYTPPVKPAKTTAAVLATPAPASPAKSGPAPLKPPKAKSPKVKTPTVKTPSGMKALARGASAFAAYTDFKGGRKEVLDQGGGNRRADAAGAFRAAGGFIGGGLGFAAGTPAGPVGQTVTGTLGYQKGADMGTKLFKRLTGKAGDKVTSQSVLKNIKSTYRDVVPQSVRQNVPDVAKKGFADFYNQAVPFIKKGYKAYRRFNAVNNLTGGDKK